MMKYYSVMRKKEILPFPAAWMDLKGIMICEISKTEKYMYCIISSIYGIYES